MPSLHKHPYFVTHNHRLRKDGTVTQMFIFKKLPNLQARCASGQAVEPLQTALAVYCAINKTVLNYCDLFS
jgi:hypothetical protein